MKQTSMTMMQSWRANCDVQVLLYDQDPLHVQCKDIAAISGYVTAYCTKGNATFQSERESIAALILSMETDYLYGDSMETVKMTRQILNNFVGQRVISKAEASCYLLDLPLYECTESFEGVSLTQYKKVLSSKRCKKRKRDSSPDEKRRSKNHLTRYAERCNDNNKSLHEFVQEDIDRRTSSSRSNFIIPYPVGFGAYATFPVTLGYAKSTLLMHQPWSRERYPPYMTGTREEIIAAFNEFVVSDKCPITVSMNYEIAKENYKRRLKAKECANDEDIDPYAPNSNMTDSCHELLFACRAFHRTKQLENLNRGIDNFDWNEEHIDIIDNDGEGESWLQMQIDNWKENGKQCKGIKTKQYDISMLEGNAEQTEIVYRVLQKLKEWIDFPRNKDNSSQFQPLLMTIQGAGGTGKSTIIHIITQLLSDMIPDARVSAVTAPTGSAAFNVGGRTCHSFFKVDIKDPNKDLTEKKRQELEKDLERLVCLIFDERSLLSMDVLGACERHCRQCTHRGIDKSRQWGGIPIVLLFGDDHQLMAVEIGSKGQGATGALDVTTRARQTNSTREIGAKAFLDLGKNVIELKKSHRIGDNETILRDICTAMREKGGVDYPQVSRLLERHIENSSFSEADRKKIAEEAIWIFHSNSAVDQHNHNRMVRLIDDNNPVITVPGRYLPGYGNSTGNPKKRHFQRTAQRHATCTFARNCRVALTMNIWPERGLYNGSMGTVKDVRFKPGETPLTGNHPMYVIVDFDDYSGPEWCKSHPTCVPVPMKQTFCDYRCCILHHMPLTLSFARTLHKFQGGQVGPKYPLKSIVFDCGSSKVEGGNPGFAYTGVSRAASLSSLYFCGELEPDRLMDLTKTRKRGQQTYKKVALRQRWIDYLRTNLKSNESFITPQERKELLDWKNGTVLTLQELDTLLEDHSKMSVQDNA